MSVGIEGDRAVSVGSASLPTEKTDEVGRRGEEMAMEF